jgi:hypothetical protein
MTKTYVDYRKYIDSSIWRERSRAAMHRVHYRCNLCGATGKKLNAHHNTYDNLGNEKPEDLTVLCVDCHTAHHGKLPLPPVDSQLPPWHQLSDDERNAEAKRLAAAVENKLGVDRPAENKRGNHELLDLKMGALFGVGRTSYTRIRKGDLWHANRRTKTKRTDQGLKYKAVRHKMHAFITNDTAKPETLTESITVAPANGATAPNDQAIATQLEQWLDRVKCIENRMDQLEAEWQHKLRRTHARHDAKNDAKNDAKVKKEIDALKKLHEEAITAVNERLDSLAKHNQQLHGCSGDDMIGLNTMMVDLDKRLGKGIRALSVVEDRLDLEIEAVTKRLIELDNKPWWRFWR